MDRRAQRKSLSLRELRAQIAERGAPELGPTIRGAGFGPGDPVGVVAQQFAIVTGQTDAKIPEDRTAVLQRIADVVLPRTRIGGQQSIELRSQPLQGVRREFLQALVAQDRAEPRRQAPGAEQVGIHLHAEAAFTDKAMRKPVARAFAIDDDDVLVERFAVRTGQDFGEALGQRRHVEALIKVQSGHRGSQ